MTYVQTVAMVTIAGGIAYHLAVRFGTWLAESRDRGTLRAEFVGSLLGAAFIYIVILAVLLGGQS